MINERLNNAIEILKFAKKNNISIGESCRRLNFYESYVRDTKADFKDKKHPNYVQFIDLYSEVLNRKLNVKRLIKEEINDLIDDLLPSDTIIDKEELIEKGNNNQLELDYRGKNIIKTVDDLIKSANIDMDIWKVDKEIVNKWDVAMKVKEKTQVIENGETKEVINEVPSTIQNYQVKLFLSKRRTEDQQKAFDDFLNTIKENAPKFNFKTQSQSTYDGNKSPKKYLLELSLPDLHIGKLSWADETGENYDTKIAVERYNESVDRLLNHVRNYKNEISEILLPIGNDLFNIDNKNNTTTAGTPQHVDSRWQQMFNKAKELLIRNINDLMQIAPVKVLMVSGNHDMQTVFYLGNVLEAYYRNTDKVTIDNSPTQRKYHSYGINLIGFTHGNEEKHQELGLIMATEKPNEWAASKCRQFHLGHFHSRKTTKYLDVQEFQGFTVRVLPSLSGTDAWHNSKGYMSMKSAVAYLYEKDNGLVAEFSHNII